MTKTPTRVQARLAAVRERIAKACDASGRARESVTLVAVSKTQLAQAVQEAIDAGQRHFGENYLQEGVAKIGAVSPSPGLVWHFIGPIQSNKTRPIAEHFAWVHAVDREKIARRLSEQRPPHLPPLNVCLQVNVSGEASKSGVTPTEVLALAQVVATLPGLRLRGLMALPEPADDFESQRKPFALLRALQQQLVEAGIPTDTLSMGMSADMDAAIAEGATIVRIGTAIFGKRDYAK